MENQNRILILIKIKIIPSIIPSANSNKPLNLSLLQIKIFLLIIIQTPLMLFHLLDLRNKENKQFLVNRFLTGQHFNYHLFLVMHQKSMGIILVNSKRKKFCCTKIFIIQVIKPKKSIERVAKITNLTTQEENIYLIYTITWPTDMKYQKIQVKVRLEMLSKFLTTKEKNIWQ